MCVGVGVVRGRGSKRAKKMEETRDRTKWKGDEGETERRVNTIDIDKSRDGVDDR
jgi:hypothetical protein